jgi:hypothetical protein
MTICTNSLGEVDCTDDLVDISPKSLRHTIYLRFPSFKKRSGRSVYRVGVLEIAVIKL